VQTTREKAIDKNQVYYTRGRINACASIVIMFAIIALLIIPIYLMYTRVKASSKADTQFLDQDGTATCIGILLVFTLLFSAILSLFTRAKRHEILGAAAG
jgi:UDP-N-acetylmuramyl pentapeptide phosphotransferase/UDP-N-acetylglucosamine-1-phosphate transferase